jgi:hypothetical protein
MTPAQVPDASRSERTWAAPERTTRHSTLVTRRAVAAKGAEA